MGNQTGGTVDRKAAWTTRKIEKLSKKDHEEYRSRVRLLLLGTGESGKSTLLKQMKLLYGAGTHFSEDEQRMNVRAIRTHIFANMIELTRAAYKYNKFDNKHLHKEAYEFSNIEHVSEVVITPKHVKLMIELWNDPGIQKIWEEKRNLVQVQDSIPFFMSRIDAVFSDDYEPTEEDWLRVRVRTTGIVEERFELDGVGFNILDVGGQRNERKKWLHLFNEVHAIIYVVALNEYDQVLFEDNNINRMVEALEQFEKTVNNEAISEVGWILFFNKSDLYREKLNKSPIKYIDPVDPSKSRFLDFDKSVCPPGEDVNSERFQRCYEEGIDYFDAKFRNRVHTPSSKTIYTKITCAMDQHNIFVVFNACRAIILTKMLNNQGFLKGI